MIFSNLLQSLQIRFIRHEIWALKASRKIPIFSLFAFGTLWIWFFVPMIPIGFFSIFLLENAGVLGAVVNTVIGIGGLALIAPWFFRWYFVCAGLMFGRKKMAQAKEEDTSARLKRLMTTQ